MVVNNELLSGFKDEYHSNYSENNLNEISKVYHHQWNAFEDALTLFSLICIPKKLLVVASGLTYYKIYSVFGELLWKANLDQPLPYKWLLIADTTEKRFVKLYNSVAVLKDIESLNKKCKYLENNIEVLIKSSSFDESVFAIKQMDEAEKQMYLQQWSKEHRDRVKTFAELFDDIKILEKQFKNTTKMSLKQLEAKKKEWLTNSSELNLFAKLNNNQDEKYDNFKVMEGSKLFEIYESAANPKIKLTETGREWEEMFDTDLRNMKTEKLKKDKRRTDSLK